MEYFIVIAIIALLTIALVFFNTERKIEEKSSFTTKQLMYVVTMSALAIVVGIFEIPFGISGVKFDLSEVVILLTYLLIGFKGTSLVIIFRSLVRFVLPAKTGAEAEIIIKFIGELIAVFASFLIVSAFILTKKILKEKQKPLLVAVPATNKPTSLKMYIVGTTLMTTFLLVGVTIFHLLFTMPIYMSVVINPNPAGKIYLFITPFLKDPFYSDTIKTILLFIIAEFAVLNIVKGILSSIVFLVVKPRIENIVK